MSDDLALPEDRGESSYCLYMLVLLGLSVSLVADLLLVSSVLPLKFLLLSAVLIPVELLVFADPYLLDP